MIHELKERDYEKVQPLFEELRYNLITGAVIEGTSPGRIYADSVADPRTAFWRKSRKRPKSPRTFKLF